MNDNYQITLSSGVEEQLTPFQILFIKMAYERIFFIEEKFDYKETPPEIRLLYIKELFTIFEELNKIKFRRSNEGLNPIATEKLFNDLKLTVAFIRNILSHFPLFNTWDDIYVSKAFSLELGGKNGKIVKFLTHDETRPPLHYQLTFKDGTKRQTLINYPQFKSDTDIVFLKDIVTEKDGVLVLTHIMDHIF